MRILSVCFSILVAPQLAYASDDDTSLSDGNADCDVESAQGSNGNMLLWRQTPKLKREHIELDDAAIDPVDEEVYEEMERQEQRMRQFVMESRLRSIREKHTSMMEMLTRQPPVLAFTLPFDASGYAGAISSESDGTQAVAYYKIDDEKIYLGLAGQGDFVGIGLNRKGPSMAKADVVQCALDASGSVTVKNSFVTKIKTGPVEDANQDWELISGGGTGGVTWCEISRARTTCETVDLQMTPSRSNILINGMLAWGEPKAKNEQVAYRRAAYRPVASFAFSGSPMDTNVVPIPEDTPVFNVTAPDNLIGDATGGSYACSYHELPIDPTQPYHIIKYRLHYDPASTARINSMAHHVNLNACSKRQSWADGELVDCKKAMPQCGEIIMSSPLMYVDPGFILPSDTGLMMGLNGATYVIINRHLYNPEGLSGIVDSGTHFQIWYTPNVRPFSQSSFVMGTKSINIPPHSEKFIVSSFCPGKCTERFGSSVHIRNIAFHLHAHGTGAVMRLFRSGVELDPIGRIYPYDRREAEWAIDRTLEPGDDIKTECTYRNDLDNEVVFGISTKDEMCVGTLEIASSGEINTCADMPLGLRSKGTSPPARCFKPNGDLKPSKGCDWDIPRNSCPAKSGGKKTVWYELPTVAPYDPPVSCGSSAVSDPEPEPAP